MSPRHRLRDLCGVDPRSLGVFRIALGVAILVDLALRWPLLDATLTDAGAFPRRLAAQQTPGLFSLHGLSGEAWLQAALLGLSALCALLLTLGYRTRLATLASWVLMLSLQNRNLAVLNGGDMLLRMLLLWGAFLPLGARFSLDARARAGPPPRAPVVGPAAFALLLQLVLVYVVAGLIKTGPTWRVDGTAIELSLGYTWFGRSLGDALAGYPDALRAATPAILAFEIYGPLLLFVPVFTGPIRLAALVLFWLFQLGLATTMQLHLFPWANTIATLPFLPSWVWDRLARLRAGESRPAPAEHAPAPRGSRPVRLASGALVLALLGSSVALSLDALGYAQAPTIAVHVKGAAGLFQRWDLYAPDPREIDTTLEAIGTRLDGTTVVVLGPDAGPGDVRRVQSSYRMKYALWKSLRDTPTDRLQRVYTARWLCAQTAGLASVELFLLTRPILPERPEEFDRFSLGTYRCSDS